VYLDASGAVLIPYEHGGPRFAHERPSCPTGRANNLVDDPEHSAIPRVASLMRLDLIVVA
jgi:hypothetical protein